MKETLVINLLSGPGCLKSSTAAGIFSLLKLHRVDCELVTEFAKDLTWGGDMWTLLQDQHYIFGEQHRRLLRLLGKVDVVVTDTSLLLSIIYGQREMSENYNRSVIDAYNRFNNINFFLKRNLEIDYEELGRKESLKQSIEIDNKIEELIRREKINYELVTPGDKTINNICKSILNRLNKKMKFKIVREND